MYYNNGDRYEGDFKNDILEGKGIYYFNDGNRMMGDYSDGEPIGLHVILTRDGNIRRRTFK